MKTIRFGRSTISSEGPCYVIAEIGHNHQGNLDTALKMIKVAAQCGANAAKFQKRDNKTLYTKSFYNKPYDNENSYGPTYGLHREKLEFGWDEYKELKKCADENNIEFMVTPFDIPSVDFCEELGVQAYKVASADLTSTYLLEYIAKLGKPMIVSTGASSLDEIRIAYETILKHNDKLVLLHCVCEYPCEYNHLNLRAITTLKNEFPGAIIGYSGHDNGILAGVIAYMLGATVLEKHFTMNRSWKGTDHKFSLEPIGLAKQVRDLRRVDEALGDGKKVVHDYEKAAKAKMGKGIYAARNLKAGSILENSDIVFKSPANGILPYQVKDMIGKRLKSDITEESELTFEILE